jgi:hypothetical protein
MFPAEGFLKGGPARVLQPDPGRSHSPDGMSPDFKKALLVFRKNFMGIFNHLH